MNLNEIKNRLNDLKKRGFIESARKGSTGVGHTLEQEMGLNETNVAIPDIGGRVELKATRRDSSSLTTLFTFNKSVWKVHQSEVIRKYGTRDTNSPGRINLYNTIRSNTRSSLGFSINVNSDEQRVKLYNDSKELLAEWNVYNLVSKFISKFNTLFLFVLADSRKNSENNREEFHYNEAYILKETTPESFISAFEESKVVIDLRMHLKPSGKLRNHGTAFRINESDFSSLFAIKKRII